MAIDPDVEARLQPIEDALAGLLRRMDALENSGSLFAARDNLETALFSAMQGMTDAEQSVFLNQLAEQINA